MLFLFFKTTVVPIGTKWWFCSLGCLEIHTGMKFGLQDISLKISMCAKKGRETGSGIGRVLLGFPGDSAGKKSACSAGDLGSFPVLGRSPGEWKGYPLSILAWRIAWTLWSMGSQRAGHDWATFTSLHYWAATSTNNRQSGKKLREY